MRCDGIVNCLSSQDDEYLCSSPAPQLAITNQYCPKDCTCRGLTTLCLILLSNTIIVQVSVNVNVYGLVIVDGDIQVDYLRILHI